MDIDSNPGMVTELRTSHGAYHQKGVHICEDDWQHYPSDIENPYDLPEGTVFVKPNRYWVLPPYRYIVSSTTGDHLLDDQCDFPVFVTRHGHKHGELVAGGAQRSRSSGLDPR